MRGASSFSISSIRTDRPDNLPVLDETDDVPDIPIPVAEYPEPGDEFGRESVAIPMVELVGRARSSNSEESREERRGMNEEEEEEQTMLDNVPLSPNVIVKSFSSRNRNSAV